MRDPWYFILNTLIIQHRCGVATPQSQMSVCLPVCSTAKPLFTFILHFETFKLFSLFLKGVQNKLSFRKVYLLYIFGPTVHFIFSGTATNCGIPDLFLVHIVFHCILKPISPWIMMHEVYLVLKSSSTFFSFINCPKSIQI